MSQYITFEVMEGAYDISCPDRDCPQQGLLTLHQMERLTSRFFFFLCWLMEGFMQIQKRLNDPQTRYLDFCF
jgi:hypothetical protein